jgi:hypothetical protein
LCRSVHLHAMVNVSSPALTSPGQLETSWTELSSKSQLILS